MNKYLYFMVFYALILGFMVMSMALALILLAFQNGGLITISYILYNEIIFEIILIGFNTIYLLIILILFGRYHWRENLK